MPIKRNGLYNGFTLHVYIDNGIVYSYNVLSSEKVREHADAIIKGGYRHNDGKTEFVHYPPHRILKVVYKGCIPTKYPDEINGT